MKAIQQRREFIKDIILNARANTKTSLVYHARADVDLMNKAFSKRLKSQASAKNFSLEFVLHSDDKRDRVIQRLETFTE